jgi:hypothetical protein
MLSKIGPRLGLDASVLARAPAPAPALVWGALPAPVSTPVSAPAVPSSPLMGVAALLGAGALVVATLLASAGGAALRLAAVLELAYALAAAHVVRLGHLVFGTRGRGHYALTAWRVVDAVLANALVHVALSLALWSEGAARASHGVFAHTGAVSAWYALYDLALYAVVFWAGGGATDNAALSEAARALCALQWAWQLCAALVLFSAVVATLATHTDEPARA